MHTLIKRGSKDYTCTVCGQSWQGESKAHCPGLKVIKADEWGSLMTKTQLGRAGYKNDPANLPAPTACYRARYDGASPEYIMLYDPAQCVRKKPSNRPRKRTGYLSTIIVPLSLLPLIDLYKAAREEYKRPAIQIEEFRGQLWPMLRSVKSDDHEAVVKRYHNTAVDLATAVTLAQLMADEELACTDHIRLMITPSQFLQGQVYETRNPFDAHLLSGRIVQGYKTYLDTCAAQKESEHGH